jgi:multidrug efflux pump subunit AcrA (membrane-fusion protein)
MRPGAEIPFTVAAYPGRSFSGKVARIAQAVDISTRTMAVELDVMNGDGRLSPGTFCQVRWPVRRSGPSLFVPSASVANDGPYVCDPYPQWKDGVGRREDWAHLGTIGRGLW